MANKVVQNPKRCRIKARKLAVKYKYGLEWEDYIKLFNDAGGSCEICGKELSLLVDQDKETAYVDHDHLTNKVRGILCRVCNVALGHFRDSKLHLLKAVEYLDRQT